MSSALTAPVTSTALRPSGTLTVLRKLFDRVHEAGIRYCHWKSNQHLDASMIGATDLDLLVDRRDAVRFAEVLTHAGVKPVRRIAGDEYPGVEDYLAFDIEHGVLSHLHVHYQLTLGEKFLKGYRLPWERKALEARRLDGEYSLYVMDPHLELLVLVIRAAIKVRARDWILAAVGKPYMSGGWQREFRWLIERIDAADLRRIAGALVGEAATSRLIEIAHTAVPSLGQLRRFRRAVQPRLDSYRMYGTVDGLRRRLIGEISWNWTAAVGRARRRKRRSIRVSPTGALSVCIMGPQHEATSLARQLCNWLSTNMAVVPDFGETSTTAARRARGRGKVVIADRLRGTDPLPTDLAIALSDEPFTNGARNPRPPARLVRLDPTDSARLLLSAKGALWDSI